jgi:MAF protein
MPEKYMKLILASNSPRRKQLLNLGGWSFQVSPADVDERFYPKEAPRDYVLRVAADKALVVGENAGEGVVVIAADTTVADGNQILGKPVDGQDAARMLRQLRGRSHQVFTALAILRTSDHTLLTDLCVTEVPMRSYSDDEMQAYIATGDPLDKAGAYAIQHAGFHPVDDLQGCYANVVGLPLCHLSRTLGKWGICSPIENSQVCQSDLGYRCKIYHSVLRETL